MREKNLKCLKKPNPQKKPLKNTRMRNSELNYYELLASFAILAVQHFYIKAKT